MKIVGSVLYGADEMIAEMVASRISYMKDGFGSRNPITGELPYAALGVVRSDNLLGGVVYHDYRPKDRNIQLSIAFDRADWIRPSTLRRLLSYPYLQLGCVNVITFSERKNSKVRKLQELIGFRLIGVIHNAIGGTADGCLYEMQVNDCRWIKEKTNG